MKLSFIVPGDILCVLKDTNSTFIEERWGMQCMNGYKLRAGDQLKVSQVYIRKNGYFQSSLSFKLLGGPCLEHYQEARYQFENKARLDEIKTLEEILQLLDDHGSKFCTKYYPYDKPMEIVFHSTKEAMCASRAYSGSYIWYEYDTVARRIADLKTNIPKRDKKAVEVFRAALSSIEEWDVEVEHVGKK